MMVTFKQLTLRFLIIGSVTLAGCAGGGGGGDESGGGSDEDFSPADTGGSLEREAFCGTAEPDAATLSGLSAAFSQFLSARRTGALARSSMVEIPVVFHVISQGPGIEDGEVPDSMMADQVAVLNREFNDGADGPSTPFRFTLAGINRVRKPEWHVMAPGSDSEMNAKRELHQGGAETLNFYLVKTEGGILGYTLLPVFVPLLPDFDGIVMNFETLPGGAFERYNTGNVAVHETGHWLGLLHTFSGECEGFVGDLVTDTPAEKIPGKGEFCPVDRDSCPNLEGGDPIHNHMTYTVDSCRTGFTAGQLEFMLFNAFAFRALNVL